MKILVTPTSMSQDKPNAALDRLRSFADEIVYNPESRPLTEDELIPLIKDCDGYLAGLDDVTKKVLDACTKLKVISRYGAGYDRVDIEAAKNLHIPVTNTPGANSQAVAELAFSMMMVLSREIFSLNQSTKHNGWMRSSGRELYGKTLGIIGLGAIGKALARCSTGFNMKVLAYDPFINEEYCRENGIESLSYEEVMKQSDYVSLHLPLMDSTRHMVNEKIFDIMKDGVILINTSRGGIIDEDAAFKAIKSGKLGGLGLDAFEKEPPTDSPLFEFDNVIATPHTGAHTKEAVENMGKMAVDNLIDVLSHKDCRFIVNK